jgi:phospholipase/lecithinase/hemolysin
MYVGDYGSASADALYVVQFGGNDIRDALIAAQTGSEDPFGVLNRAVQGVVSSISTLYGLGAKNFLVANAPNLANAPAVVMIGASGVAGFFTAYYNGMLEGHLQVLGNTYRDINIIRLDMAGFTDDVVNNPGNYGLTDTATPCLNFLAEKDAKCDNPDEHLFWDGLHPTAAAHDALGDFATTAVNAN